MEKIAESNAAQARNMSTQLPSEQFAFFHSATGTVERNLKTVKKIAESSAAQARNMSTQLPSEQSAFFHSGTGAVERNLKTVEMPEDIERKRVPNTGLEEMILDRFSELHETLCAAQRKAGEVVRLRSRAKKEVMPKEKDSKEQELHALARKA